MSVSFWPLLAAALLSTLLTFADGHVRFVCPKPKSLTSSLYRRPPGSKGERQCDGKSKIPPADGTYTLLSPGPYTLRFEETEYHKNSPFRISLHQYGDNSFYCILLDQIPHNNEASTIGTYCDTDGGLIGGCKGSTYFITVHIPDIDCDNCYLQVTFINTDTSTGDTCRLDDYLCTAYCSMANVKIKATEPGMKNLSYCENYADNLYGKWPFTPRDIYKVKLPGLDPVTIVHEVTWQQLTFRTQLFEKGVVEYMSVCNETDNSTTHQLPLIQLPVEANSSHSELVMKYMVGEDFTVQDLQMLKAGQLHLHVTTTDGKDFYPSITLQKSLYEPGIYRQHSAPYTSAGWLAGPQFVGTTASYPIISWGFSNCSYTSRYFISQLHPTDETHHNTTLPHGVIGVTFMESRAVVTATFVGLIEELASVKFVGPDLGGAPDLVVNIENLTDQTIFIISVDASRQIPYFDTVQFLKRVEIYPRSDNPHPVMVGEFEEGMLSVIRGPDMRMVGQAVFQFSRDGEWHGLLMVRGVAAPVHSVQVFTESQSDQPDDPVLHLNKFLKPQPDGSLFGVLNITGQDSEFYLNLWLGKLYVAVVTDNMSADHSFYRGQVSVPGAWYCTSKEFGFCPVTVMQHAFFETYHKFTGFTPHGLASFVLDRVNVFYYSIHLEGFEPMETVTEVNILNGERTLVTLSSSTQNIQPGTRVFHLYGSIPGHSPEMLKYLTHGTLKVCVKTSLFKEEGIIGQIPMLQRTQCGKSQIITVGGTTGWSPNSTDISNLSIVQGDMLGFVYGATENVILLKDKDHFQRCDFTDSRPIGNKLLLSESKGTVLHPFPKPGTFYIASQSSCNSTQPLKMVLTVIDNIHHSEQYIKSHCRDSVYMVWRQAQLDKYHGVDGVAASLGGVVVGLVILSAVLLWDRLLNAESSGVNGFERF
ncbi:Hypothetical predicted protein [Octopus vulgaris]|uniref:Uncharacterized protein n=1 Tax=Octopus vulgaris TaxID=6645 RepID=A0AA36FLA7_OCTVU|nr:Hypothetical predicted protein [Octopus vulgaris]